MKKLFVLVCDAGDGSYHPRFTFNQDFISKLEHLYHTGIFDYESGYSDGDGFHYDTLNVPKECTPESMGFKDCAWDLSKYF